MRSDLFRRGGLLAGLGIRRGVDAGPAPASPVAAAPSGQASAYRGPVSCGWVQRRGARLVGADSANSGGRRLSWRTAAGAGAISAPTPWRVQRADGYTLLLTAPGPLVINQALYAKLSFDPGRISPRSR